MATLQPGCLLHWRCARLWGEAYIDERFCVCQRLPWPRVRSAHRTAHTPGTATSLNLKLKSCIHQPSRLSFAPTIPSLCTTSAVVCTPPHASVLHCGYATCTRPHLLESCLRIARLCTQSRLCRRVTPQDAHLHAARFEQKEIPYSKDALIPGAGVGQGVALIFVSALWGGPLSPGTPPPPPPPHSKSRKNPGSGNLFSFGPIFFTCTIGAPIAGSFAIPLVSFLPYVADITLQRPISMFFGTLVQPCPHAKRDDVLTTILYFRFQDRWSGKKRQEVYNAAQKACSTLFLSTPVATLCEFVRQAAIMVRQDPKVSPTVVDL